MEVINEDYYFFLFHEICILVCRCSIKAKTITKEKNRLAMIKENEQSECQQNTDLQILKYFYTNTCFFLHNPSKDHVGNFKNVIKVTS